MRHARMLTWLSLTALILLAVPAAPAAAQDSVDATKGTLLLTIFLRHDQSKTLDEINA